MYGNIQKSDLRGEIPQQSVVLQTQHTKQSVLSCHEQPCPYYRWLGTSFLKNPWSHFRSVHCPLTVRAGPHIEGVYSTACGQISWRFLRKIFFCTSLIQLLYLFWSSATCFGERIGNLPQKKTTKWCYLALFISCHLILLHVLEEHMLDMLSTLCTVEGSSCSFNIPQAHIEVKLPRAVSMAWYLELSHMCQRALSLRSKGLGSMPQTLESLNCNSL